MSNKAKNLIKKHFFYDMPHRGDYLNACKICHARARLIDDIQHKRSCEVGATIKELANSRVKNENGHRMSETAADYCDQLKRENANLKAENRRLRGIILTIFVLEYDLHKMRGHECYAKHWALSLLDRVKRLKKGKADE